MAILNKHHITYAGDQYTPDWEVEVKSVMHKVLTIIQRTKPTVEEYVILMNFLHAIMYECNRYRCILDNREKE